MHQIVIWGPNINLMRDGRWGRAWEAMSSDPLLTAKLAAAFVHGAQGTREGGSTGTGGGGALSSSVREEEKGEGDQPHRRASSAEDSSRDDTNAQLMDTIDEDLESAQELLGAIHEQVHGEAVSGGVLGLDANSQSEIFHLAHITQTPKLVAEVEAAERAGTALRPSREAYMRNTALAELAQAPHHDLDHLQTLSNAALVGLYGAHPIGDRNRASDQPHFLRSLVTAKHWAAYSLEHSVDKAGNWHSRHGFVARITHHDFAAYYSPAFKAVVDAGVSGIMCSYNSVGLGTEKPVSACYSHELQTELLREKWGFKGYVVGDTDAVDVTQDQHFIHGSFIREARTRNGRDLKGAKVQTRSKIKELPREIGVLLSLDAGVDVESSVPKKHYNLYADLIPELVREGKLSREMVVTALARTLRLRFAAGLFNPPADQPDAWVRSMPASTEHDARDAAQQSFVLLENNPHLGNTRAVLMTPPLPLKKGEGVRTLITGPWAKNRGAENHRTPQVQYLGAAMRAASGGNTVSVDVGYETNDLREGSGAVSAELRAELRTVDQVVLCLGTDTKSEKEGVDRTTVTLPKAQEAFALSVLKARAVVSLPVVLLLTSGGPLSIDALLPHLGSDVAVVQTFWPGSATDELAQTLYGTINRWGKLPYSIFLRHDATLHAMDSMDIAPLYGGGAGRTYRYISHGSTGGRLKQALYPFGWGLSYTTMMLSEIRVSTIDDHQSGTVGVMEHAHSEWHVEVKLTNTGTRRGDEVVQLYACPLALPTDAARKYALPDRQLVDFRRVALREGESTNIEFVLSTRVLATVTRDDDGVPQLERGRKFILIATNGNVHFDGAEVRRQSKYVPSSGNEEAVAQVLLTTNVETH